MTLLQSSGSHHTQTSPLPVQSWPFEKGAMAACQQHTLCFGLGQWRGLPKTELWELEIQLENLRQPSKTHAKTWLIKSYKDCRHSGQWPVIMFNRSSLPKMTSADNLGVESPTWKPAELSCLPFPSCHGEPTFLISVYPLLNPMCAACSLPSCCDQREA